MSSALLRKTSKELVAVVFSLRRRSLLPLPSNQSRFLRQGLIFGSAHTMSNLLPLHPHRCSSNL